MKSRKKVRSGVTSSALKMGAVSSSKMFVPVHQSTWHHIPEDYNLIVIIVLVENTAICQLSYEIHEVCS